MKLSPAQIERTTSQFEAQPIPQDNRMVPELKGLFGEHTFFLDNSGLHIVEPAEADEESSVGRVVKLASWTDAQHTTLAAHPPEETDVIVALEEAA